MVLTKEYRTVLPLSLQEYQRGLYHVLNTELQSGKGGDVLTRETYTNDSNGNKGVYVKKLCPADPRVPSLVKAIAPEGSLDMYEETWDCYPDVKTVLTNGYKRLDGKFTISIHTLHIPGASMDENPFNHSEKELKDIVIVKNDILTGGTEDNDVTTFESVKTGRGKLTNDWIEQAVQAKANGDANAVPLMCCYTVVEVKFGVFGLQSKIEKVLHGAVQNIIKDHYRKLFCSIDLWYDLTLDTIWAILDDKEKYKVKGVEDAIAKLAIAN